MSQMVRGQGARERLQNLGRLWQALAISAFALGGVLASETSVEAEIAWSDMVNGIAESVDKSEQLERLIADQPEGSTGGYTPEDGSAMAILLRVMRPLGDAVEAISVISPMDTTETKMQKWREVTDRLRVLLRAGEAGGDYFQELSRRENICTHPEHI